MPNALAGCSPGSKNPASPPPDDSAGTPAATINPPDLSGGPLGCFSVFCVPRLAFKAVAGCPWAMLGIGADPPQVHRRKVHGRSQFAPDFAAGIKSALLYLRENRAAYAGLPGELPLRESEALPVIQDHPGQRPRFVLGTPCFVLPRISTVTVHRSPSRCLRRISHAYAPFRAFTSSAKVDYLPTHAITVPSLYAPRSRRNAARATPLFYSLGPPMDNFL